jgi:hypothetical protein
MSLSDHLDKAIAELQAARALLAIPQPEPEPEPEPQPEPVPVAILVDGDLQAAVDAGPAGATYVLSSDVTYGPVTLRGQGGTIRTHASATEKAKIRGPVVVESGTWLLIGLDAFGDLNEVVLLSEGAVNPLVEDCTIRGDKLTGAKRGITLNSQGGTIRNCRITDIKRRGQDAVGVGGWNGPGGYVIEDCYISASGSAIMFGGADPTVKDLVPTGIDVINCTLTKDPPWRDGGWTVKNIFELKNARKVRLRGCTLAQSWTGGQTGFAITLTVRNQDGTAPWSTVEDVLIVDNTIEAVGAGVQLLGRDNNFPSGVMRKVVIEDNRFTLCNVGAGRQIEISGGPEQLELRGNTFTACPGMWLGTFLAFSGPPVVGFTVVGNRFQEGEYGIHSSDASLGVPTLEKYAPGYVWEQNTVKKWDNGRWIPYPAGTRID